MPRRTVRHPLASRRTILAVLAGLLSRPAAVRGQTGGMCQDLGDSPLPGVNHPDFAWLPVSVSGATSKSEVRLQFQVAADGRSRVQGGIRLRDDAGMTTLMAEPASAQASCDDANGDGRAGLTQVQFMTRDAKSRERVPVTLAASEGEDIDSSGFGFVTFQDGEQEVEIEVEVRLLRPQRASRGRRGRRR